MKISHNRTILYVDDDKDDLEMLQNVINQLDVKYKLVEATDGVQGLDRLNIMKLAGELPCLIVLDINMPKMDGKQAFNLIRSDKDFQSIPIVIFSTSHNDLDKLFFKGKDVEFITKPINYTNLVHIASRFLDYCSN